MSTRTEAPLPAVVSRRYYHTSRGLAFARRDSLTDGEPEGQDFIGVFSTRDKALEHCWPPGDPRWIEERVVR